MPVLLDDDVWQRLHDVRLRGMVQGDEDPQLVALTELGYVVRRGSATAITAAGRMAHKQWARLPQGSEVEAIARRAYDQFPELDVVVKRLTMEWQLAAANRPPDGFNLEDWKLIDRLTAVHERLPRLLLGLSKAVPRFAGYGPRLRNALARLEDGEAQWFSGVTCDSYHTVWWRLHEDLLLAIGVDRSDDPNQ